MKNTRRLIVCALGSSALGLASGQLIFPAVLQAADAPKLSPDDSAAKSLAYTHASSDTARQCVGCQFYKGSTTDEWGPCVIFPDRLVNARGLCNSWYAKA